MVILMYYSLNKKIWYHEGIYFRGFVEENNLK
jgi:hypothetical protein